MEIHILDWVMCPIIIGIYWFLLDKMSDGEYTNEIGGLVGIFGAFIIVIIHIILFWFMGWNWVDIFNGANPISWLHINL